MDVDNTRGEVTPPPLPVTQLPTVSSTAKILLDIELNPSSASLNLSGHAIDTEPVRGDEPHLVSFRELVPLGLRILVPHKVLICIECEVGLLPSGVSNHLKSCHNISLKSAQREGLERLCLEESIVREANDLPITSSFPFALPGLKVEAGHCCNSCPYVTKEVKTLSNHWYSAHTGSFNNESFHKGSIQKILTLNIPSFEVRLPTILTSMSLANEPSLYEAFLTQIAPSFPTLSTVSSTSDNDIIPLLKVTNWNHYVQSLTGPHLTPDDLMSWVAVPRSKARQTWEGNVRDMVLTYMEKTREIGITTNLDVQRILMEAPRYVILIFGSTTDPHA